MKGQFSGIAKKGHTVVWVCFNKDILVSLPGLTWDV